MGAAAGLNKAPARACSQGKLGVIATLYQPSDVELTTVN